MSPKELTAIVELSRRPLWQRLLRFPGAWKAHYRLFRKELPFLKKLYASYLLASMLIKVKQ